MSRQFPPLVPITRLDPDRTFRRLRDALDLAAECRSSGVALSLADGDQVAVEWDEDRPPPEGMIERIKACKPSLLRLLEVEAAAGREVLAVEARGGNARWVFEKGWPKEFEHR